MGCDGLKRDPARLPFTGFPALLDVSTDNAVTANNCSMLLLHCLNLLVRVPLRFHQATCMQAAVGAVFFQRPSALCKSHRPALEVGRLTDSSGFLSAVVASCCVHGCVCLVRNQQHPAAAP